MISQRSTCSSWKRCVYIFVRTFSCKVFWWEAVDLQRFAFILFLHTAADSERCEQLKHECTCPYPPHDRMASVPERFIYMDSPPPYYVVVSSPPPAIVVTQRVCTESRCAARDGYRSATSESLLDNYRLIAIVFTAVCFVGGCWPALACTVPAIFFASAAREAKARGNTTVQNNFERIACSLNCGALVVSLAIVSCLIAAFMRASLVS